MRLHKQTGRAEKCVAAETDTMTLTHENKAYLDSIRLLERVHRPDAPYVGTGQTEVTDDIRSRLINRLMEIAAALRFRDETLYLAVNYMDRFFSLASAVPADDVPLVGITALWLASKFEEVRAPTAAQLLGVVDHLYTAAELVAMESRVLSSLQFHLASPTSKTFQQFYLEDVTAAEDDRCIRHVASLLLDMSLLDSTVTWQWLPSELASASVYLACQMLQRTDVWADMNSAFQRKPAVFSCAGQLATACQTIISQGAPTAVLLKHKDLLTAHASPCAVGVDGLEALQ
jgi:cyclin A